MRYVYLAVAVFLISCARSPVFENYIPLSTGSKWLFESQDGTSAEISVYSDSLTESRDTVFNIFFLGDNIEFVKTPNTISWMLSTEDVVNDEEVVLERRFYPFFEQPFISGEKRRIVYEDYNSDATMYFRRVYEYEYDLNDDGSVNLNIWINSLKVRADDSTVNSENYTITLVPDTGFKRIVLDRNGNTYVFELRDLQEE